MSILLASQRRRSDVAAGSLLLPQHHSRAILPKRLVTSLGRWLRMWSPRPLDPERERLDNHRYLERERRELAHARYASLIRPF